MSRVLIVILLGLALIVGTAKAGVVIGIDNDFFSKPSSDNNYSHATSIGWRWTGGPLLWQQVGIRQALYTWDQIQRTVELPSDHPYCGFQTAFWQGLSREDSELVIYEVQAGVLGPAANGELYQNTVHRIIGQAEAERWDTQLANEPVLNLYMERRHQLVVWGREDALSAGVVGVYGGALGTTFINLDAGLLVRLGWNIPVDETEGLILLKAVRESPWWAYVYGKGVGYGVLHNVTLGDSYFNDPLPCNQRTLEPFVTETTAGVSAGYRHLSISYYLARRSLEFENQLKPMDYGGIILEFTTSF